MSQPIKLLLISPHSEFLKECLPEIKAQYSIQTAATLEAAEFLCQQWMPDIALVDFDAIFESQKTLAIKFGSQMAIFSISRMQAKELTALRFGADQFASSQTEKLLLLGRIESLARRMKRPAGKSEPESPANSRHHEPLAIGELLIYPNDYLIKRKGEVVSVTPTQFKLLVTFASKKDQLLSREWLKENVWENAEISLRSIDAQISKLKKMVPELDHYLVNVYGKGYVFSMPKQEAA